MRIGAIQSCFIPWRGYFDFIASVDHFVFLDDVQYTKRDWRTRNKVKTPVGTQWVTVPVVHQSRTQLIQETRIDHSQRWQHSLLGTFRANYARSTHWGEAARILEALVSTQDQTVSELNIRITKLICEYLGIDTPLSTSSQLRATGLKSERLISIVKALGGSTYLSGPSADNYLDKNRFQDCRIRLEYKSYDYPQYPQLWGSFEGGVTILDLIANCGIKAAHYISSQTPDKVVVP